MKKLNLPNYYKEGQEMETLLKIFIIDVIIKLLQLYYVKIKQAKFLEDLQKLNGIVKELIQYMIKMLLYFQLLMIKNSYQKIMKIQLDAILIMVLFLVLVVILLFVKNFYQTIQVICGVSKKLILTKDMILQTKKTFLS